MQPAQRIQLANDRDRLIHMDTHASVGQGRDEGVGQIGRAETVDRQIDFDPTPRGIDQVLLNVAAHTVFEQNESLDHDLVPGCVDRFVDRGQVRVAVFEQVDAVATDPFHLEFHNRTSPASGA